MIRRGLSIPAEVHFTVHDTVHDFDLDSGSAQGPISVSQLLPQPLDLPNPKYLRLRAACCRVAHLSGAAERLDDADRDMDEAQVIAKDGSSAELLETALQHAASRVRTC